LCCLIGRLCSSLLCVRLRRLQAELLASSTLSTIEMKAIIQRVTSASVQGMYRARA
jgi:hypothetical protein